ncbi:hypothetical protein QUW33_06145 [Lactobacillus gallinarum]|nr:hypothetical protein [Lactobacillus gallinarum]MDM8277021.1 hypothetical protein [Lactobacillus gallinarum]
MKNKLIIFMTTALFMLAIIVMGQNRVDAASWGAKNLFTTPKKTRGTWYYKHEGEIKKLKITTHTFNKIKLYKMLSSNKAIKWTKKLAKADKKSGYKLAQKVGTSQYEATDFKFHKTPGFAANGWLSSDRADSGHTYVAIKKKDKSNNDKVDALRVGNGADNSFLYYCYKSKELVK